MIKAVTFFLIFIIILGIFGKLRWPKLPDFRRKNRIAAPKKCPKCNAYIVGSGPCPCQSR
ncbi:thymidine kinase [Oceanibium sediminis]|uniref:thymidine kinase n=1 Tax=Oceanibium sediminis TaxID=2026339 RepID=UPI000DD2DA32|nr:thymidine kinase [Oceanibium sediminis]